jgi:serine/threonine protein kinase/tetratricopeptide (TPR) repeat protein
MLVGLNPGETLAAELAEEMAARWAEGERPPAEEFLDRHPELWSQPEAGVLLVYEEICLRQEYAGEADPAAVVARFACWRARLEKLLDCRRVLEPAPLFPSMGESLGEFRILAELGRGAAGRVFLAAQRTLDDRPVVLKVSSCSTSGQREHQSLARLQHTHIVPLYAVLDFPERNLRVLCMPYFGGVTLEALLEAFQDRPAALRTGKDILAILDRAQAAAPLALPARGPARQFMAGASYVEAVCMIGAWLADALDYAHRRDLVHLDVKPANVLIAADGQPMLLDFHLAQGPLRSGAQPPRRLGGTPFYMAPEQQQAVAAVREERPVPAAVDGRADVYALGLTLYQALGGSVPPAAQASAELRHANPAVSVGLADLLERCLAPRQEDRYPDAAALTADLERYLQHQPLRGVRNRSLRERWAKLRRRQPAAFVKAAAVAVTLTMLAVVGTIYAQLWGEVGRDLADTARHLAVGAYGPATESAEHGLRLAAYLPGGEGRIRELNSQLRRAQHGLEGQGLHTLVEQFRLYGAEPSAFRHAADLAAGFRGAWQARARLLEAAGEDLRTEDEQQLRADLGDLAIIWASWCARGGMDGTLDASRREALRILTEAEETLGPTPVLLRLRASGAAALGRSAEARAAEQRALALVPRTASEHAALGRYLLASGDLSAAAAELQQAVAEAPERFWPNHDQGVCAYRAGRHRDAVEAFRVCIALRPDAAWCYYNRGRAYEAQGSTEAALADYGMALARDPQLGAAALNRGLLLFRAKKYAAAEADLERAAVSGPDPATAYYTLAQIQLARGDRRLARLFAEQALRADGMHRQARELSARLARG